MRRLLCFLLLLGATGCFVAPDDSHKSDPTAITDRNGDLVRPDGPINDAANLLSVTEEAVLDRQLRALFEEKQTALIVVTVPSLRGQTVQGYANNLAKTWKVGGSNGGVLLLVAPTERQVRIELDNKVSARISDAECSAILKEAVLPKFRQADFVGGIFAGVDAIAARI